MSSRVIWCVSQLWLLFLLHFPSSVHLPLAKQERRRGTYLYMITGWMHRWRIQGGLAPVGWWFDPPLHSAAFHFGAAPFTPIVTQTISLVRFRVCLSPVRSSVGCVTLIQIREILNLPQLTPEEEARAREEHRWLFEDTN